MITIIVISTKLFFYNVNLGSFWILSVFQSMSREAPAAQSERNESLNEVSDENVSTGYKYKLARRYETVDNDQ